MTNGASNFQVDLHGVVDLLSHHLYSSPRVYLRELLQNAVDAITARRREEAGAPARVDLFTDGSTLTITDTGIGLSRDQVIDLLATIGRSSKRDQIGFAREEFLGQFGIGLLSAFMVADQVEVVTRRTGERPVRWVGHADGTYDLSTVCAEPAVGTTVTVVARPGAQSWFAPPTVQDLVTLFGSALPVDLRVNGAAVTGDGCPWGRTGSPGERQARLVEYAQEVLGFTPFDVIDLDVPAAGLDGVAFVLPFPASPAERPTHRIYLKRMLLAEHAEDLLPDWAFFVRCLVNTQHLTPTASREALYDDEHLEATRFALAEQIRAWLVRLGATDPVRLRRFLDVHHLGVKALALHDDEMLWLVDRWVPFETSQGQMTLAEARARTGDLRYCTSVDQFRQLGAVAAAQGLLLVNAGYAYDSGVLARLGELLPEAAVRPFEPSELATALDPLPPEALLALRPFTIAAQKTLDDVGVEVVVRAFDPPTLPALYLVDRAVTWAEEVRSTRARADGIWADVLGALDSTSNDLRPQLVLNHRSPLLRRLATVTDSTVVDLAVEGLYGHALMQGRHPLRPADATLVHRSFLGLVEQAVNHQGEAQ